MKSKQEILTILKSNKPYLRKRFRVKELGLFGSFAREDNTDKSDIDILVDFYETPGLFEVIRLERFLSSILNGKVEVIRKPALRKEIRERVLNETIYS